MSGHVERRGESRYRARYRGPDGRERSRTFTRRQDARRFLASVESAIASGEWIDPSRSAVTLAAWAAEYLPTRTDLRASTRARLESTVRVHLLPKFGERRLSSIGNAEVRRWVGELTESGLSAASVRKAVFALRQMLDAAIADQRLTLNPAANVPLPTERRAEQRFLDVGEVEALADAIDPKYRALVLLGAYGGLRYGELAGLRRSRIDVLRSRVAVDSTAVDVGGVVTFGEPKTVSSRRTVPLPRSIMRQVADHLAEYVAPEPDALAFTSATGGPLYRGTFWPSVWSPAVRAAGLEGLRVHDLRHTFVALLTAAGANVKEVSVWAGHSSVAFTLDRYGHLYEDHADDVAERLDDMLSTSRVAAPVRSISGAS